MQQSSRATPPAQLASLPASENSFDTAAQYVIALHRMGALE